MNAWKLGTHKFSLRARATTWYVGLLAVALVVFSIGIYAGVQTYLKLSLQRGLSGTASTIASDFLAKLPRKGEAWVLGEVRESYAASPEDHFVRLSSDGKVLYQTSDMREPSIRINEISLPVYSDNGAFHRQSAGNQKVLIYSLPYRSADGRVFEIEAGTSLFTMDQTLRWLARILCIATVVILVLATIGGYFLMVQPLRPLVTLTEKAANIGRKQLGERLPVIPTGDELERLTHSLNGMIDRLENALSHNYRFSADASHELRTPLTIMRGELEELLRMDDLPASATENLVSTLDEIDRMSRIVNSLMVITRLDAGGEKMDMRVIDLSVLVQTTTDHMRLLADEKGLPLECICDPNICVYGDAMRLKQVIVNLVDNAIKYTSRGTIRVTVSSTADTARLTVADQGIGITQDALPYVFDRFYRADFARSRGEGGVGLGLAIVKSIVTIHDGTVAIQSVAEQGSTVTVLLPLLKTNTPASPFSFEKPQETRKQDRLQNA